MVKARAVRSDEDIIVDVVSSAPEELAPSFADSSEVFHDAVLDLLEHRLRGKWKFEDSSATVAVFVFADTPTRPFGTREGVTRVEHPRTRAHGLFGRIFFLDNKATMGSFIDIPGDEGETLFWLRENGFGACSAVLADKVSGQASLMPRLDDTEEPFYTPIKRVRRKISVAGLEKALDAFHIKKMLTPTRGSGAWARSRAKDYVPIKNAEIHIQRRLKDYLGAWFHEKIWIEQEVKTDVGRIDLQILVKSSSATLGLACWGVIELKVAKSYSTPRDEDRPTSKLTRVTHKTNMDGVVKGYGQADAFACDRDVNNSFLEVFDMRKVKSPDLLDDSRAKEKAEQCVKKVRAKVRKMFGSSEEIR